MKIIFLENEFPWVGLKKFESSYGSLLRYHSVSKNCECVFEVIDKNKFFLLTIKYGIKFEIIDEN